MAEFRLGDVRLRQQVEPGAAAVTFANVELRRGTGRLEAELRFGGSTVGVNFVDVEKKQEQRARNRKTSSSRGQKRSRHFQ